MATSSIWPRPTNGIEAPLQVLGPIFPAGAVIAFSASTTRRSTMFRVPTGESSITSVKVYIASRAGTGGTCQADVYAVDSSLKPTGASLGSGSAAVSATGILTIDITDATVTAGDIYCIVIQNTDGTPGTNSFSISAPCTVETIVDQFGRACLPYAGHTSTDSGATWTTTFDDTFAILPNYGSGGTTGDVFGGAVSATAGLSLYNDTGSRRARVAIKWNAPYDFQLFAILYRWGTHVGSPTFNLKGEVCSASASLTTSDNLVAANATHYPFFFGSTDGYLLSKNTDYYLGITPDGDDDGTASVYARIISINAFMISAGESVIKGCFESTAGGNPSWSPASNGACIGVLGQAISSGGSIPVAGNMRGGFIN